MASAQNNVAFQRKEAPIAAALTEKRKLQSLGRKKLLLGKREEGLNTTCSPAPAAATATFTNEEVGSKEEKEIWCTGKKGAIGRIRSPIHNNWNKGVCKF